MSAFEEWDKDFAYGANESLTTTLRAIRKDAFQAGRRAGMDEAAKVCVDMHDTYDERDNCQPFIAAADAILAAKGE